MYRAFELAIDEAVLRDDINQKLANVGKNLIRPEKKSIEKLLREAMTSGTIDGTALSERYLPTLKRDVFLSYSHDDMDLAYMIAGMLDVRFNLKTFIDSKVISLLTPLSRIIL